MQDRIRQRIKELEAYRDRLMREAQAELDRVTGGIAELKQLLEPEQAQAQEATREG